MTLKVLNPISAVMLTKLPCYSEENGDVVVMEGLAHVPFPVARVFVVRAPAGAIRGQHAHKICAQFLTCPIGKVEVLCDDGLDTANYIIDQPDIGLFVPPGIWAQQAYQDQGSVLTVLCNRPYEKEDYIRDYDEFKEYRQADGLEDSKQEKR
jgi:hypothetical protein